MWDKKKSIFVEGRDHSVNMLIKAYKWGEKPDNVFECLLEDILNIWRVKS